MSNINDIFARNANSLTKQEHQANFEQIRQLFAGNESAVESLNHFESMDLDLDGVISDDEVVFDLLNNSEPMTEARRNALANNANFELLQKTVDRIDSDGDGYINAIESLNAELFAGLAKSDEEAAALELVGSFNDNFGNGVENFGAITEELTGLMQQFGLTTTKFSDDKAIEISLAIKDGEYDLFDKELAPYIHSFLSSGNSNFDNVFETVRRYDFISPDTGELSFGELSRTRHGLEQNLASSREADLHDVEDLLVDTIEAIDILQKSTGREVELNSRGEQIIPFVNTFGNNPPPHFDFDPSSLDQPHGPHYDANGLLLNNFGPNGNEPPPYFDFDPSSIEHPYGPHYDANGLPLNNFAALEDLPSSWVATRDFASQNPAHSNENTRRSDRFA